MGGKQLGFSDYELTTAKKQTKREKFLSVRWMAFIGQIRPLTSLTPGGKDRVWSQCRPHGEFCLPMRCAVLHGRTSRRSGPD